MEIIFFDLETTGVDTKTERIVEMSMVQYTNGVKDWSWTQRFNPMMPIPKGASDVHGITDDMVKDEPKFDEYAAKICQGLTGKVIGGFNSNHFDVPLLYNELQRCGVHWDWRSSRFIDVGNLFKIKERRTLEAASLFYLNKPLDNAHSAEADVICTAEVFFEQMKRYELPESVEEIELICNYDKKVVDLNRYFALDENNEIILNFGKHKGDLAKNCKSYLSWMSLQDFPKDTIDVCNSFL